MSEMQVLPIESLGRDFVPAEFLPEGMDEYYLRNQQAPGPTDGWRNLRADEIETLVKNANASDNWDDILVTEQFAPHLVKNCQFHGLVRIGRLEDVYIEHHDLRVPVGLTNSRIIACDIGDNAAIHQVRYLAHYIIGDNVVLLNLDEMHTTNHAKFGNGIVKDGEDEDVRVWMELVNENGERAVMPFDGMLPADAMLWSKYRDDSELLERLGRMTQGRFDSRRGYYGTVGQSCVIKNCRIIKDVKIGPEVYIKGANKLKNLTINSSAEEPTQIGEGVELVNGIIGRGCHIFYGCKAVRFILGDNSNLKYGARLIHSFLGDNSTVSCCELISNLIFPAHEQHHNNSFLIAALVMGQSNMAANATIGSNHNSRAPDGEIHAGRGFWPGLCVSVKHNCRFASFTLLAKGDYPAEMDIPLPFALVSNARDGSALQILPAYWWMYNMYALARNTWKFGARDKRQRKLQHVEFNSLAPDTAEEMFRALELIECWTGQASLRKDGQLTGKEPDEELIRIGRQLLTGDGEAIEELEVLAENVENSRRKVVIIKPRQAYEAYRQMLHYYAVKELLDGMRDDSDTTPAAMAEALSAPRRRQWVNLGGQLVAGPDVAALQEAIRTGSLDSWQAVHAEYDRLWDQYPRARRQHALATLLELLGIEQLTGEAWADALDHAVTIQEFIAEQTYLTRKKDDENPYRRITFDTPEEMRAVLGSANDNSFVTQVRQETQTFAQQAEQAKNWT
ncbi:MAG: DUF4954 family protein [Phycisphaerae bacterium]|jgi:hypothetical protein|nr:DUF4954 family protein [Phycisphaerae bacterium]